MRDRLITALGALGALAVVYLLFLQRPAEPPVTRPLSVEAGRNGYLALASWLKGQGIAILSWRRRLDALADDSSVAATGNVLITTMPYVTPLRSNELVGLRRWIAAGNTLLILAALDDTPEWSSAVAGIYFMRDLAWLTGLTFTAYRGETSANDPAGSDDNASDAGSGDAAGEGASSVRVGRTAPLVEAETVVDLAPVAVHPLFARVESLHGFSDVRSEIWQASDPSRGRLVLKLAKEASTGLAAFWQLPTDRGQILLSASGTWLANRNIAQGNAREFVANLIAHQLGAGGAVIFDDMHQGLSVLYDAAALVRDPRLKYTALFLLAAWLIYLLGASNRLAAPLPVTKVPRQADFLAAAGGFMARRLDRCDAGLMLLEDWFAEVRRRRGVEGSAPPWAEIEATPALGRGVCRELRESYERLQTGRAVDLVRLHNVLRAAREAIG